MWSAIRHASNYSAVIAAIQNEWRNASLWALWAIFLTLFLEGHYQLP